MQKGSTPLPFFYTLTTLTIFSFQHQFPPSFKFFSKKQKIFDS